MTPKIRKFLDETAPEAPRLVVDLDIVAEKYRQLQHALPLAAIYYAVKANPARPILDVLVDEGSHFDAASIQEVNMCLAAGAEGKAISYGNTVKKKRDIAAAFEKGVTLFAFDCEEELHKIAEAAPGASVFCRIETTNEGADWPLTKKFGCRVDEACRLMIQARDLGLDANGISFHVGSQQTNVDQWDVAIGKVSRIFTDLRDAGIELKMINLGGGYAVRYREDVPDFEDYGKAIMDSLTRHFGNNIPHIVMEPGRAICGEAGVIESEVVLVSNRATPTGKRWVYLDVGMFGGLAETMDESIKYQITSDLPAGETGPVILAGPTCDGVDIMYEKADYLLPLALTSGDKVYIHATGAYTTTYASQGFNGLPPMKEIYL